MKTRRSLFRPALYVLGIFAVVAMVAVDGTVSAKTDQSAWKAVSSSGKVQARGPADSDWQKVSRGAHLEPGTLIRTGRTGRTSLTRNSSIVIVDPDTEIELDASGSATLETTIRQNRGRVLYEVDRRKTPHFEVVTPYLVAGVKGTTFDVEVSDRSASVGVERGRVDVINNFGERMALEAGDSAFQNREDERMERADLRAVERRRHTEKLDRWNSRKPDAQRADNVVSASKGRDRGDRDDDSDDDGLSPGSDFASGRDGAIDSQDIKGDRDDDSWDDASRSDESRDDDWTADVGGIEREDDASIFDDLDDDDDWSAEDDVSGKSDDDPVGDDERNDDDAEVRDDLGSVGGMDDDSDDNDR